MELTKITEKQKSDLYMVIVFAKTAKEYAELITRGVQTKREAKMTMNSFINSIERFTGAVRASITTEEGKRQFDAEWQKDYLSYASIFHSLVCMSQQQIEGVERFCQGVISGEVEVVLSSAAPELKEYVVVDLWGGGENVQVWPRHKYEKHRAIEIKHGAENPVKIITHFNEGEYL